MNGNLQNNRKNCQYSFINDNILYAINKPKKFKTNKSYKKDYNEFGI